jgi:hypothetical protein
VREVCLGNKQAETGANIKLETDSDQVKIYGAGDAIRAATEKIQAISAVEASRDRVTLDVVQAGGCSCSRSYSRFQGATGFSLQQLCE